jgi:hypothetical protein
MASQLTAAASGREQLRSCRQARRHSTTAMSVVHRHHRNRSVSLTSACVGGTEDTVSERRVTLLAAIRSDAKCATVGVRVPSWLAVDASQCHKRDIDCQSRLRSVTVLGHDPVAG